jgi:hypothetical protein
MHAKYSAQDTHPSLLAIEIVLNVECEYAAPHLIVAYRPVARQRQRNNEKTPAARQQILNKQQLNNNSEERCVLYGPYRDFINGISGSL